MHFAERAWVAPVILAFAALAIRLLFLFSTPGCGWPHSIYFKGDSPLWLDYAQSLQTGRDYELGLPMRPPGQAYLLSWLWNGRPEGVVMLRIGMAFLGAATVGVFSWFARRAFGHRVSWIAGAFVAGSTSLMLLSSSLDNETPYLFLVVVSLLLWPNPGDMPRRLRTLGVWSILQALMCLLRAEHALFWAVFLGWGMVSRLRDRTAPRAAILPMARAAATAILLFLLPILPWQIRIHESIHTFNSREPAYPENTETALRLLEQRSAGLLWDAKARARAATIPAFVRRKSVAFVAATKTERGEDHVGEGDLEILRDAYGYFPRPLPTTPFITLYGPMNFALANNGHSRGGFTRRILDDSPPLRGGADRYPDYLVSARPPRGVFSFEYLPHLALFEDGYRIGIHWIVGHPGEWLALAARKLDLFWSGAAGGFTGLGLPLGMSGTRPAVDMVRASGFVAVVWRACWLLLAIWGLRRFGSDARLRGWVLFGAFRAAIAAVFFGYLRQGSLIVPLVGLLAALLIDRWLGTRPAWLPGKGRITGQTRFAVPFAAIVLLLAIEVGRALSVPDVRLDGARVGSTDPEPGYLQKDVSIETRYMTRSGQ